MFAAKLAPLVAVLAVALAATGSLAMPYYFFQEAAPQPPAAPVSPVIENQQVIAYDNHQQQQPQPQPQQQPQQQQQQTDNISKLGKDISEAFHQAKERLEPHLQSAGETMVPLVKQAQEKVPEALSKVGQQVRGVWDKLTSGVGSAATSGERQQQAGNFQEVGQNVQQAITGAIQSGAVAQ